MCKSLPILTRFALLVALLLTVWHAANAAGSGEEPDDTRAPVIVVSKIDTEGALLGNMIVIALENAGIAVDNRVEFGPTDVVRRAITAGEADIYPEYTGNGAFFFDQAADDVWKNGEAGYERVAQLDRDANDIVWLTPARANNTWAIAVRQEVAEAGVTTLDDIGPYLAEGGQLRLAASEEFVSRPDVLPAFQEAYSFELVDENLLVFSGGNTATTIQAAARNQDGVNATMTYGTDGQLSALGLTVLDDTRGVQPVYWPTPIVRAAVLDAYPDIDAILEPIFESLDRETLQSLNAQIAIEGQAAETVARDYLSENGFI